MQHLSWQLWIMVMANPRGPAPSLDSLLLPNVQWDWLLGNLVTQALLALCSSGMCPLSCLSGSLPLVATLYLLWPLVDQPSPASESLVRSMPGLWNCLTYCSVSSLQIEIEGCDVHAGLIAWDAGHACIQEGKEWGAKKSCCLEGNR